MGRLNIIYWISVGVLFVTLIGVSLTEYGIPATARTPLMLVGYAAFFVALYANHRIGVWYERLWASHYRDRR